MSSAIPSWLVNAVQVFSASNTLRLAVPFVVFSLLLVAARGVSALRMSDETLRSVTVTLVLSILNGFLSAWVVFKADLTEGAFANIGLPTVNGEAFWNAVPWPLAIVLVLFAIDFCDYWTHRIMHRSHLWGVHAIHHSDPKLSWMTTFRVHFMQTTVMHVGYFALMGWVDVPLFVHISAVAISFLHNCYVHVDLGWSHGPLDKVVASPNIHRWHHSVEPSAYNKNYANVFTLYDVAFGTYYNPGKCTTEVGLDELPNPGVVSLMLYPATYLVREFHGDGPTGSDGSADPNERVDPAVSPVGVG